RSRSRLRPFLPHLHDPAPSWRRHHGQAVVRDVRCWSGRNSLQVCFRRQRRSDDRNRTNGKDACRTPPRASYPVTTKEPAMASATRLVALSFAIGLLSATACSHSTSTSTMSTVAPNPDPRVGLKAGVRDAGEAIWNLKVLSRTPPSEKF